MKLLKEPAGYHVRSAKNPRSARPHTLFWRSADRNRVSPGRSDRVAGASLSSPLGDGFNAFHVAGEKGRTGSMAVPSTSVPSLLYHRDGFRFSFRTHRSRVNCWRDGGYQGRGNRVGRSGEIFPHPRYGASYVLFWRYRQADKNTS